MCAGPPHGGLGIERILGQGVTDGIRASTFAARARAGQGRVHMAYGACGPGVDTRHGICVGTVRTVVYRGVVLGICRVCGVLPRASALEGGECNTPAYS